MRFKKTRQVTIFVFAILFSLCSIAYAAPMDSSQLLNVLPGEPGSELTRAEFAAMLVKAADLQPGEKQAQLPTDVKEVDWYADSIKTLISTDIMSGYADGTIMPDKVITQAEAVAMIAKILGLPQETPSPSLANEISISSDHWAYNIYTWFVSEGILEQVNAEQNLTPQTGAELLVKVFGTAEKCKEINDKIEAANKSITSLRLDGTMEMQMNMRQVNDMKNMPLIKPISASIQSEIVMDKGSHTVIETVIPVKEEEKPLNIEQYMTNEGIFMNMPDPDTNAATWLKMPSDMFPNMMDLLKQQSNPIPEEIKQMFHYRYLGEGKIGDQEVLQLAYYGEIKDMAQMMSALSQLDSQLQQSVSQHEGLLKSLTFLGLIHIDKETYLPLRIKNFSVVNYTEEFQGKPFPMKSIQSNLDFTYSDYNAKLILELPEEALNAKEFSLPDANIEQSDE